MLEVGPGTGAVTRRIVQLLKPHDKFDLVELNESFVEIPNRRFAEDPDFRRVADRLAGVPVSDSRISKCREPYDVIVCGLPFNNFPPDLVREIFGAFFKLLAPGGVLSYFEYM